MDNALEYILTRLEKENLRHEIHKFPSGAMMIDIWKDNLFYVVQIEGGRIGLSLVTSDSGFDAVPDKSYDDFEKFNKEFENVFK